MYNAILELHEQIAPSRDVLKESYWATGGHRKNLWKDTFIWNRMEVKHASAFGQVKLSLYNVVDFSRKDLAKIICVHAHASDKFWSGTFPNATQRLHETKALQTHQPFVFL